MVIIFNVYGKSEGMKVGEKVNRYFKQNGYCSFFTAPNSPDVKSGKNFQKESIDPNLAAANVVVVIVTPRLWKSKAAKKEIRYSMKKKKIIVPYVRGNTKFPKNLRSMWTPVKFAKGEGGLKKNLEALDFSILRRVDSEIDWTSGTKPQLIRENTRVKTTKIKRRRIT